MQVFKKAFHAEDTERVVGGGYEGYVAEGLDLGPTFDPVSREERSYQSTWRHSRNCQQQLADAHGSECSFYCSLPACSHFFTAPCPASLLACRRTTPTIATCIACLRQTSPSCPLWTTTAMSMKMPSMALWQSSTDSQAIGTNKRERQQLGAVYFMSNFWRIEVV